MHWRHLRCAVDVIPKITDQRFLTEQRSGRADKRRRPDFGVASVILLAAGLWVRVPARSLQAAAREIRLNRGRKVGIRNTRRGVPNQVADDFRVSHRLVDIKNGRVLFASGSIERKLRLGRGGVGEKFRSTGLPPVSLPR